MNFKNRTLGEIIQFKNGKKRPQEDGQYPVYGGNGILGYSKESNYCNCIAIGRVGAYCGSVYYEPESCWISDNAIVALPKEGVDIRYTYYLLKSAHLNRRHIGTGQPLLTQDILNRIECAVPSLQDQKRISSVLWLLDEKITENQRINNNLEQQAKAIYRQMFATSSSSEWTQGTLSDIAEITMGQSPSGSSYNEDGVGTVFYQGRAEFGCRFPTQRLCTTEPKRMARENDVLLSVRAPVGDLNVAREYCCIGRGLASIRSKHNRQSFVLYTVFALQPEMDKFNGEGTVFGSINRDSLNKMAIIIPTDDEMDRFESLVSPMDAQIRANHEEILRLEAIRAALLPKLMTGELDVSNIEY